MKDFYKIIESEIQKSILRSLQKTDFVTIDYENKYKIPSDFIVRVYESIDEKKVFDAVRLKIEDLVADKIINSMQSEIATDVKKILSNTERREELRSVLRQHMKDFLK